MLSLGLERSTFASRGARSMQVYKLNTSLQTQPKPLARVINARAITFDPTAVTRLLPNELYYQVVPQPLINNVTRAEQLYNGIPEGWRPEFILLMIILLLSVVEVVQRVTRLVYDVFVLNVTDMDKRELEDLRRLRDSLPDPKPETIARLNALIDSVEKRNLRRVERVRGVVYLAGIMMVAWWTSDESVRDTFLRP